MSKALLQSSVKPELIHRLVNGNRHIEVWTTTCIVTNFRDTKATVLINPSNPQLSGVRNFPYFPRGGPVPHKSPKSMHKDWQPLGFVSQWGGMEVGTGMLYPVSVVDGLVHQMGGWKLEVECRMKDVMAMGGDPCPIGQAVVTTAGNDRLQEYYKYIVHTTPPFFKFDENPRDGLHSCYTTALSLAFAHERKVATPLLGAGARGFPTDEAIDVAALATKQWFHRDQGSSSSQTLLFGLLERKHADELANNLEM